MKITIHEEKNSHFTFHGEEKGRSRVTKIPFTTLLEWLKWFHLLLAVFFLQTLGKLYYSFGIGAQIVDAVSLSLQDAENNVSSVNEYIKNTVATVK